MKNKLEPIENAIDIWSLRFSDHLAELDAFRSLLSEEECARADQFVRQADAERAILSRGLLRTVLASYLAIAPKSISIQKNENGKPFLEHTDLEFNVSHAHDRMLIAVTAGRTVGVDIEFHRDNVQMDAIAQRWFSTEEQAYFHALETPKGGFFEIWSKKEAYVKAQGLGIYFDLTSFTVPLGENTNVPSIGNNGAYFFQTLGIDPAYSAAVVSETPAVPVVQRAFGSITI